MTRTIDILVLGATGFTGRLITRYLDKHSERSSFSLSIAGRSPDKLRALSQELQLNNVDIYPLDISNDHELNSLISKAKVVVNCVGPFHRYGTPIVRACARTGTHYCDITGESPWIYELIQEYDYLAKKQKTILIPAAGMDSVPLDYVVYLSIREAKRLWGANTTLGTSKTGIWMPSSASGGTLATGLTITEMPRYKIDLAMRPYALSPVPGVKPPPLRLYYTLPHTSWFGGISLMRFVNVPIVQRSWGLNRLAAASSSSENVHYAGPNFTYDEFAQVRRYGILGSVLWSVSLVGFLAAMALFSPFRWFVGRFGPQPGTGPSDRASLNGVVELLNVTATDTKPERYIKTSVKFKGNAYFVTAITTSEIALSLLLDHNRLPKVGQEGGILTSSVALGDVLVERLEKTGRFDWKAEEVGDKENRKRI